MKKFLVLFFVLAISLTTVAFAENSLTDISNTKYEEAVNALVSKGIVNGYKDKTFRPNDKITRAEIAKLLVLAGDLDEQLKNSKDNEIFSDVSKSHWAFDFINVAYNNDYIEGNGDGTFSPDNNVTYAEAITMVVRMLGYTTAVEAKGEWPDNYIKKAQSLKLLSNVDYDEKNDEALRGEVANLIWNALSTTKTYYKAGILESVADDKLGDMTVKIDGTEYSFEGERDIKNYIDSAIFYRLKQEKDEATVTFISAVSVDEILADNYDDYVEASDSGKILFEKRGVESFKDTFNDDFHDYIFIKFEFDPEEKEATNISLVTTYDKVKASDFDEFDRIYIDTVEEVAFIIEGLDEVENLEEK